MDSGWIQVIGVFGFFTLVVVGVGIIFITRYKVKVEQIKADAMIRAEEIRAKNQLDLEALCRKDRELATPGDRHITDRAIAHDEQGDENKRQLREKT